MKKFAKLLAMVLAVSMVLTMFVGAYDYKDAASIDEDKADAVKAVYEAGIMMGDDKGNFNPTNALTRDEMAKILYVMTNADQSAKAVYGVLANEFDDADEIPNWSKNFIGYAAATSYLKGDDKNEVNAKDNLTYVEAAIVLLRTLGLEGTYKVGETEYADFTGPKWFSNALFAADQAGLLAGLDIEDFRAAITREDVAVMIANAMNAQVAAEDIYVEGELVFEEGDNTIYVLATAATGTVIGETTVEIDDEDVDFLVLSNGLIPMGDLDIAEVAGKEIAVVFEGDDLLDVVVGEPESVTATLDAITIEADEDDASKYILSVDDEVVLKNIFDYELYIFDGSAVEGVAYDESTMGTVLEMMAAEMQKQEVTIVVNENSVSLFYAPIFFIDFDAANIEEDYDEEEGGWLGTYKYNGTWAVDADYESLEDGIYAAKVVDNELILVGTTTKVAASKVIATKNAKGEITVKVDGEKAVVAYDAVATGATKADVFATINDADLIATSANTIYTYQGGKLNAAGTYVEMASVIMYGDWIIGRERAANTPTDEFTYAVITDWYTDIIVDVDDLDDDNNDEELVEIATIIMATEAGEAEVVALKSEIGTMPTVGALYEVRESGFTKVTLNDGLVTKIEGDEIVVDGLTATDDTEYVFVNMVDDAELADVTVKGGVVTVSGKKVLKQSVMAYWVDAEKVIIVYDLEKDFGVYADIAAK